MLISGINRKYVHIANRMTSAYEKTHSFLCDLYFPKNLKAPDEKGEYNETNIFNPHEDAEYNDTPDVKGQKFVIPFLLKKIAMNSPEDEFDSFYTLDDVSRPFIETSKANELPIQTKVIVYLEQSTMRFWVDKKLVVNGADGHLLLRMYLSPLAEG